ncbi:MAG: class I SAM-dependent methyltransferase [Rubrobacter sp.]|nr:class I SAM-dependent methyltransferase [Rubrobacter sp.]
MFRRNLLPIVRPRPSDTEGLVYVEGVEENGEISAGKVRSPVTGDEYRMRYGYLDLLPRSTGAHNVANLTNLLPGAGRGYEPLWRVRSLTLLTGERFPNGREIEIISDLIHLQRGGLYLDLGCSGGLYAREMARALDERGAVIGVDISPSMLREAERRSRKTGSPVSLVRADVHNLPFADAAFSGIVCGGTLNELGDPARALREARRVLEPGGRLAIMGILRATTARGQRIQRFLSGGGIRFFQREELHSLLDHAGFAPDPPQTYGPVVFASATRR